MKRRDFITLIGGAARDARGASRAGNIVRSTQPPERSSFALTLDGGAPEELLKAGKYEWVSDYARQIVDSKILRSEGGRNRNRTPRPLAALVR
jgi:hypothetical protein